MTLITFRGYYLLPSKVTFISTVRPYRLPHEYGESFQYGFDVGFGGCSIVSFKIPDSSTKLENHRKAQTERARLVGLIEDNAQS